MIEQLKNEVIDEIERLGGHKKLSALIEELHSQLEEVNDEEEDLDVSIELKGVEQLQIVEETTRSESANQKRSKVVYLDSL